MKISWLPYREISIFTPMTVEGAASTLAQVVIERRFRWFFTDQGKFEGVVTADGFNINRVTGHRNTFRPILRGSFVAVEGGTQVITKMTLSPLGWVATVAIWGFFAPTVLLILLSGSLGLGPAVFLLLAYLVPVLAFSSEADKATTFLQEIFQKAPT